MICCTLRARPTNCALCLLSPGTSRLPPRQQIIRSAERVESAATTQQRERYVLSNVSFPQKSKYEAVSIAVSCSRALARLAGLIRLDSLDSLDDSTSGLHSRTSPRAEDRREATRRRGEAGGARSKQGASHRQQSTKRRWPSPLPRFTTPEGCCVAAPSGTNICGCMFPSGLTSAVARRWLEQVLPIPATEAHTRGVEESYISC